MTTAEEYAHEIAAALLPFARAYERLRYYGPHPTGFCELHALNGNTSYELFADGREENNLLRVQHLEMAYEICSRAKLL